jgi:hypothetical protein
MSDEQEEQPAPEPEKGQSGTEWPDPIISINSEEGANKKNYNKKEKHE